MILALAKDEIAILISLGSLSASLLALGFQLWNALRIDRASLKVTMTAVGMYGAGVGGVQVVSLRVVNQGKRPTKLNSLWLQMSRGRWSHRRWWPKPFRRDIGMMLHDVIMGVPPLELPMTLDVGGEAQVFYRQSVVKKGAAEGGYKYCSATAGASTAHGRSPWVKVPTVTANAGS